MKMTTEEILRLPTLDNWEMLPRLTEYDDICNMHKYDEEYAEEAWNTWDYESKNMFSKIFYKKIEIHEICNSLRFWGTMENGERICFSLREICFKGDYIIVKVSPKLTGWHYYRLLTPKRQIVQKTHTDSEYAGSNWGIPTKFGIAHFSQKTKA